jgi:uncharacterized membrane protein
MIDKEDIIKRNLDKISTFIDNEDLEKASKQLLDMLYAAMSSRYMDEVTSQVREDMMHFYTVLLGLIEGIHWLGDIMIELFKEHISQDTTDIKIQCPYEDYLNTAI